jgi:hypothetical protein
MSEIHYLPKDAVVPVEVGAGLLFRLQKLLLFLVHDKTKEELEELKERVEKNDVPEDSWMFHYITIHSFITIVEHQAMTKKITVTKDPEA